MSQAIQKRDLEAIAKQLDYSVDYVQTVKDTVAKGATDLELKLFLQVAKRTGLDPFAKQIYCVKRWDGTLQREVAQTQISIDGFRLIAERSGQYVPGRETTYTFDQDGKLESATAYIKKLAGGTWHEVAATAYYTEYVQKKKNGEVNPMWQRMPRVMLGKCAEALVLRKSFPAELSGLYTPDEMGQAETHVEMHQAQDNAIQGEVIDSPEAPGWFTEGSAQVANLCKALNATKRDEIVWTGAALKAFVNDFCAVENGLADLFDDQLIAVIEELEGRLDALQLEAESEPEPASEPAPKPKTAPTKKAVSPNDEIPW